LTRPYLKKIKESLSKNSNVFIGYWHDEYLDENNINLSKIISNEMGRKFKKINCEKELSSLLNFDEESMGYYGNRLHAFRK
jgi:hypothetical protein